MNDHVCEYDDTGHCVECYERRWAQDLLFVKRWVPAVPQKPALAN